MSVLTARALWDEIRQETNPQANSRGRVADAADAILDAVEAIEAGGSDGITPHIGENGNWYIGTTDTGVKAAGVDGIDGDNGITPHIGENGNWYIGATDTGVKAAGADGTVISTDQQNLWSKDTVVFALSDETSDLTASASVPKIHYVFRDAFARTLNSIIVDLNTAPTGSSLTIDIKKNGNSIFSTLLTVDAGETSNATAAVPYVLTGAITFSAGDYIDVYVTVVGSTVAGKGLKINMQTTKTL